MFVCFPYIYYTKTKLRPKAFLANTTFCPFKKKYYKSLLFMLLLLFSHECISDELYRSKKTIRIAFISSNWKTHKSAGMEFSLKKHTLNKSLCERKTLLRKIPNPTFLQNHSICEDVELKSCVYTNYLSIVISQSLSRH